MSLLAGIMAIAMMLTACGSSSSSSSTPSSTPAKEESSTPVVLKLHHAQATTHPFKEGELHPYQAGAELLAKLVNEKSNGSLQIEIYPAGSLGEDEEVMELMREGIVDMSLVMPVSKASGTISELNVFNFPFLFVSEDHGLNFAKSESAQKLLGYADNYDLKAFGFSTFLFRYPLNTKMDITKVSDFDGLKLRTMGTPAALDAYAALGATTVSMDYGELYSGLQLGQIDGVENDMLTLLSNKYYEQAKHLSMVPVWPFASVTLMSKGSWEALSPEHQSILDECIPLALDEINNRYRESIEDAKDILAENGVVISEPTDMQSFVSAVQCVYDTYLPELSPELQEIVQEIVAMGTKG